MIYHLTTPVEWKLAQERGDYSAPSLDSEGFIHCSTLEQVVPVANAFYQQEETLLVLIIDESKLNAVVKWEPPVHIAGYPAPDDSDEQLFPHVYGTINLNAVVDCVTVPQDDSGYVLPKNLA